ncbi:MAG: phosphotransferase [Acidimicrobiia bacterium]
MIYHMVGVVGTFPLRPFASGEWGPPVADEVWGELTDVWTGWFGPFDELALYRPRQAERSGFAGLLFDGPTQVGFVKWRPDSDFQPEATLIDGVSGATSFDTPSVKGVSSGSGWSTMGLSPIPPGLHSARLSRSPIDLAEEISELLESLIPPDPVHGDWKPMHGDMGPWNLRHLGGTGPILFDWELSRRAPPGADLVFHRAASRAMRLPGSWDVAGFEEAVRFWITEIPERFAHSPGDQRLASEMLDELRRLG